MQPNDIPDSNLHKLRGEDDASEAARVAHRALILQVAQVCHEANRAYCATLGDWSQPTWGDAPHWQKDSAIKGVEYHLAHPHSTPADSHNSWLKEKQETGWKYGPVKDPVLKEHPCFVPYEQLPFSQKVKDYVFLSVVRGFEQAQKTVVLED